MSCFLATMHQNVENDKTYPNEGRHSFSGKEKLSDPSASSSSLVAVFVILLFLLLDLWPQIEVVEVLVLVDRRHVVA